MTDIPDVNALPARNPPRPFTLRQEWILVGVASLLFMGAALLEALLFPEEFEAGKLNPLTLVHLVTGILAQALWITMDRKRRGLEVGWWRFGVLFVGPLAIWLYLAVEYRLRALYLVPISALIYAVNLFVPGCVMLIL